MTGLLQQRGDTCPKCGEPCGHFYEHGTFADRGDGYCSRCGRTRSWHAGRSCFCRFSSGLPEPVADLAVAPLQLALEGIS